MPTCTLNAALCDSRETYSQYLGTGVCTAPIHLLYVAKGEQPRHPGRFCAGCFFLIFDAGNAAAAPPDPPYLRPPLSYSAI